MRKLWVLVMGLLMSIAAIAEVVTLKPGVPERYVVQKGDTLWDISRLYLEDPWRWSDIWYINPQIANPHLIYPGDVLGFVVVDGETKITKGFVKAHAVIALRRVSHGWKFSITPIELTRFNNRTAHARTMPA